MIGYFFGCKLRLHDDDAAATATQQDIATDAPAVWLHCYYHYYVDDDYCYCHSYLCQRRRFSSLSLSHSSSN